MCAAIANAELMGRRAERRDLKDTTTTCAHSVTKDLIFIAGGESVMVEGARTSVRHWPVTYGVSSAKYSTDGERSMLSKLN